MEVRNRFKELDLIDRVPEERWTEVCNIVQEVVIKIIPKKKKCKKVKWLSKEALQIAEKRKEVKGKGEKERYTHLIAKFQRIACALMDERLCTWKTGDRESRLSDRDKRILVQRALLRNRYGEQVRS